MNKTLIDLKSVRYNYFHVPMLNKTPFNRVPGSRTSLLCGLDEQCMFMVYPAIL